MAAFSDVSMECFLFFVVNKICLLYRMSNERAVQQYAAYGTWYLHGNYTPQLLFSI